MIMYKLRHRLAVLLAVFGISNFAHSALVLSADEEIRQEEIAGICMLASSGVYEMAIDRQNGVDKEKAKKNLAKELKKIEKNFKDQDLVAFIDETWNNGLSVIYKMPVYDEQEDKESFISQAVNASFLACFNDLDN